MPIFQWKARTRQGSLKKGEIEAMNEAAVMAQLRSQMLLPVTVKEKSKDVSEYLPFLKQGIKTRDLVIFTRQFATMIDAGLPLVQCLDILANQQPNKTFQRSPPVKPTWSRAPRSRTRCASTRSPTTTST
jgi:type IV pilus assembly protein PilC